MSFYSYFLAALLAEHHLNIQYQTDDDSPSQLFRRIGWILHYNFSGLVLGTHILQPTLVFTLFTGRSSLIIEQLSYLAQKNILAKGDLRISMRKIGNRWIQYMFLQR